MGKTDNQAYEVQVHQNGRWQVHARYDHDDRVQAIAEAKQLSMENKRLAIRVIMEDYHPDQGHHDEVLIYRNRVETNKTVSVKMNQTNWADMAVSSDGRVGFLAEETHDDFAHFIDFDTDTERKKTKISTGMFLWIVFIIVGVGIVSGALAAGALFMMVKGFGATLAPSALKSFIIGIFLLVGFIASISTLNHYRVQYDLNPFSGKKRPTPKVTKSKISKQMEKAAEAIDKAPSQAEIRKKEQSQVNIFERAETEDPRESASPIEETQEKPPQNQETAQDGPEFSFQAQQQKLFLVNFLGAVMGALKGPKASIQSLNRFALNLFMTGAVARITQDHALSDDEEYLIHCQLLEMLGAKNEQAERFAMEYEKFLVDQRHSDLFLRAGELVHAYRDGDPALDDMIRDAIENWVNHKKHPEDKNPNQLCVFFTDMVGSTDLTTRHGDYAAQEVLKAHDLIVRTALTNFDGTEIKHLGDGIMASFADTDNALEAAREMLKRVEGNNNAGPEFPLHIRIGINVGEPIRKNNDLFGNVVQLAARLCSVAETDHVAVSKFLVEDCGPQTPHTFDYLGLKPLKGFDQPMDVYHLDWKAPPRVIEETDDHPDQGAPETEAKSADGAPAVSEVPAPDTEQAPKAPPPIGPGRPVKKPKPAHAQQPDRKPKPAVVEPPKGPKKAPQKNMHPFSEGLPIDEMHPHVDSSKPPSKPNAPSPAPAQPKSR